jgi:hypothetical protein
MLQTTVGVVTLYDAILEEGSVEHHYRRMISLGAFVQMLLLIFMRVAHKGVLYMLGKPSRVIHFCVRIMFSFFHFSMRWYKGSPEDTIMLHALIASIINCLDIYVALNARGRKEVREDQITMGIYSAKRHNKQKIEMDQISPEGDKHSAANDDVSQPHGDKISEEKQKHASSIATSRDKSFSSAAVVEDVWVNENPMNHRSA